MSWGDKYAVTPEALASRLTAIESGLGSKTLDEVIERAPSGARVLEIGCGTGQHSVALKRARPDLSVTAVDMTQEAVAFTAALATHAHVDVITQVADVTALPFSHGAFDVVFGDHVIGHVPDIEKALTECARVLKPGGLFVVNAGNLLRLDGWPFYHAVTTKNYFAKSYTPWRLTRLAQRSGFKKVSSFGSLAYLTRGLKVLWSRLVSTSRKSPRLRSAPARLSLEALLRRKSRLEEMLPAWLCVEYGIVALKV